MDLKEKYAVSAENRNRMARLKGFFQKDLLRSNPGMTSVKFKEELEELRQAEKEERGDLRQKGEEKRGEMQAQEEKREEQ